MTVMMEGKYTDAFLAQHGADAPKFTDEELKIIGSPIDFIGTNIYVVHAFVRASDSKPGYEVVAGGGFTPKPFRPYQPTHPRAVYPGSDGKISLSFSPESMYWGTRLLRDVWGAKEIYVTESACRPPPKGTLRASTPTASCGCGPISPSCSERQPRACRCVAGSTGARWTMSSGSWACSPSSGCFEPT
jgi:hypothetical protein